MGSIWAPHVSTSIFSTLISHPTSLCAAEDEQGVACGGERRMVAGARSAAARGPSPPPHWAAYGSAEE